MSLGVVYVQVCPAALNFTGVDSRHEQLGPVFFAEPFEINHFRNVFLFKIEFPEIHLWLGSILI